MAGPEFGPGGYLPPKAAKRARKIVLRAQMGWGWPLAALAAAVLVAVAGGAYVLRAGRPPQAPFVAVGPLTAVEAGGAEIVSADDGGLVALVVRAGGRVRAFRAEPGDVAWCDESRRLETDDAAWTPDGRVVHGEAPSLTPLRSVVFKGVVYVDPRNDTAPPPPGPDGPPPVCGAA